MPSLADWDVEQYRGILRAHAAEVGMQIGTREDPSDIVQETMVRVLSSKEPFLGEHPGQRIAWLLKIQKNVFIDKLREHHADKRDIGLEAVQQKLDASTAVWIEKIEGQQTSPSHQAVDNEQQNLLDAAMLQLPERERDVMRLHLREKLTTAQIAERLHMTRGAVAGLIARASARLAEMLRTK